MKVKNSTGSIYWILSFLLLRNLRGNNYCDVETLLDVGSMMSVALCQMYNDSNLGKINGFILTPNSTLTLQDYDFVTGKCGPFYSVPMHVYWPLVFKNVHTCLAAIPVWSHTGNDGRYSITGYGDLIVATQSKIKEMTLIYTQPRNDCTLLLDSMIMLDVQCIGLVHPTTPTTSTSSSPTQTTSKPVSSSTTSMEITSSPFFDEGKYTSSIENRPDPANDSYNNPIYHQLSMPICPVKHPRYKLVLTRAVYKHAALVCLRKGLRLASLRRDDLGDAIDMVGACLGGNKAVWIGQYWNRRSGRRNQCLELVTGSRQHQGTINVASSCSKEQAVLCEEPYIEISN